jgi:hypothetical protein
MIKPSEWTTVGKPGWFGEAKNDMLKGYDEKYGEGNWRIRHQFGLRALDFSEAVKLYEICYELHFLNPDTRYLWIDLMKRAADVWTEEERDVESGMDYSIQKAKAPHYEDVAIRIILDRYGKSFKGDRLIRIRADSPDTVGVALSSIHIPFAFPQHMEAPIEKIAWWTRYKDSLEYFWHCNKILQVKK